MVSIAIDRQDGLSSATAIKGPCRVATTANISLTGQQSIDGVAVVAGDRVLVKNQAVQSENGIYVADTGPWRRAKDFSGNRDVKTGTSVWVTDGTMGPAGYTVTTTAKIIVIGITAITFEFSQILDYFYQELQFSTGKLRNSTRVDYPIVIMYTGQSNMLGHSVTNGDRSTKNPNVWIFEAIPSEPWQTVGWKNAGPDSPDWPMAPTGNSIPWHVADEIQRITGRTVLLIGAAAGGQPVSEWLPGGGGHGGSGIMWAALGTTHAMALDFPVPNRLDGLTLRQTGRVRADFLLWHQGEADANYRPTPYNAGTKEEYKQRFRRFLAAAQDPASAGSTAEPMLYFSTPVIMGELLHGGTSGGQPTDDRNDAIADLANSYQFINRVSSRNIPSLDNLHFTGAGLVEFASRYVRAMFAFPKPDLVAPVLITNCDTVYESGLYRHSSGATGAPTANSGFLEHRRYIGSEDFGFNSSLASAVQTWHQAGGAGRYRRYANISGAWQAWEDISNSVVANSTTNITIGGKLKQFTGSATLTGGQTLTITLPETMANNTYVPWVNLASSGTSTPTAPFVTGRTTTNFTITNTNASQSIIVSWGVLGMVAN